MWAGFNREHQKSSKECGANKCSRSSWGKHVCVREHESSWSSVVNWCGCDASQLPDRYAVTAWVSWQVHSLESVGELSLRPGSRCGCICVPINVAETITCNILADANICQGARSSKQSKNISSGWNYGWKCRVDSSTCEYCTISDSRCGSNSTRRSNLCSHWNSIFTKELPTPAVKSGSITQSPSNSCDW